MIKNDKKITVFCSLKCKVFEDFIEIAKNINYILKEINKINLHAFFVINLKVFLKIMIFNKKLE